MKPPWFPKVAHAVHRVEVPVGQRDWMRETGWGRRGKGDWVLSYNYDAFSVAANSICFGHIKMLSVLPTIRVSPIHFTLSLLLPLSLPLFLAAFLFLLLTKRTNWIYLLRISNAHKVNFCQLPRICTVPYIYTINIRYICIYMGIGSEICLYVCWEDIAALFGPVDGWKIIRFDFICIALTDLGGAPRSARLHTGEGYRRRRVGAHYYDSKGAGS